MNLLSKIPLSSLPRRLLAHTPRRVLKLQAAVLLLSLFLSLLLFLSDGLQSSILPGGFLSRGKHGSGGEDFSLEVLGLSGKTPIPVKVHVSASRYTKEEAEQVFAGILSEIEGQLTKTTESLDAVKTDLFLPRSFPKLGVKANWNFVPVLNSQEKENGYEEGEGERESPGRRSAEKRLAELEYIRKYRDLISSDGRVHNEILSEGEEVHGYLELRMSTEIAGESGQNSAAPLRWHSEPARFYVCILPRERSELEKLEKALSDRLLEEDRSSLTKGRFRLPDSIEGHKLHFREKRDQSYLLLPLLGLFSAVLLYLRESLRLRERAKKRELSLLLDYSDLVSKLLLYLGAGLSLRNAFEKISEHYEALPREDPGKERALPGELRTMLLQLKSNVSESEAYRSFARRISLKPYARLIALIEQKRRNGSRNLREALKLEMEDAFECRKNTAKRLGEEASTKLLLPLLLQLGIILLLILFPAMSALSGL